jgi:predicted acylesterase/phospholipase RssA
MTVAFALSGGGNLGPMQAGAVVALLEAGITPDLLVGTSVGALNAAFLSSRPGLSGAHRLVDFVSVQEELRAREELLARLSTFSPTGYSRSMPTSASSPPTAASTKSWAYRRRGISPASSR